MLTAIRMISGSTPGPSRRARARKNRQPVRCHRGFRRRAYGANDPHHLGYAPGSIASRDSRAEGQRGHWASAARQGHSRPLRPVPEGMGRPAVGPWNWPTMPRLKVFIHLSFSELFDLGDLWHEVPRPQPIDGDDSATRRARYKARLWDEFNYYGLQDSLAERWAQLYGLVQAKSHSSYRRLFASSSIGNGAHEDNHPPCCDHTTLWRRKGR
jgi:hypothetical protein